jgi:anti-sigma B factor antagonist
LSAPERLETILNSSSDATDQGWKLALGDTPGTVVLSGEIDFSGTPKVREALLKMLAGGAPEISFDMAGLSYIDSSGLALLLEMRRILTESGRTMRITSISPQVRKLFNLTQLGDLFGLPE